MGRGLKLNVCSVITQRKTTRKITEEGETALTKNNKERGKLES